MQIYKFVSDGPVGELQGSCGPPALEDASSVGVKTHERFPQCSPRNQFPEKVCVLLYTRFFAVVRHPRLAAVAPESR